MAGSDLERARGVEIRRFPPNRRLVTAALRAGSRKHAMYGLLELDVTEAARLIEERCLSRTAFVIASVARAVALHPEVQAYRDFRGRLVVHRHVDVSTIVEIPTDQGSLPLVHLVRDADIRDVSDISNELHVTPQAHAERRRVGGGSTSRRRWRPPSTCSRGSARR